MKELDSLRLKGLFCTNLRERERAHESLAGQSQLGKGPDLTSQVSNQEKISNPFMYLFIYLFIQLI